MNRPAENDVQIPEHAARFCERLEDYFEKPYTEEQAKQLKRWAMRHSERVLKLVLQSVIAEEKFKPLIATLRAHVERVYEGYPELDPWSHNRQQSMAAKQITDDAGFTEEELDRNFARLREIVGMTADAKRFE